MQDGTQKSQKVFMNIPTEVGATEAEAIGEQTSDPTTPRHLAVALGACSPAGTDCRALHAYAHKVQACEATACGVAN